MSSIYCSTLVLLAVLLVATDANLWFLSHLHTSALGPAVLDGAVSPYTPLADYCIHIPNLTGKQKRMCERQPDAMKAVFDGIQRSMAECQQQFAKERWNCSTHDLTSEVLLKLGSREAAFIYAISSAGVVHHLAHVCAKGVVDGCGCAQAKNYAHARDEQGRLFRWGGCGDNVQYAAGFARRFVDAGERPADDERALMNLHNNRAGRKAVRATQRLTCKCHGVSGACTTRTCWVAVDRFDHIGQLLRDKYKHAIQVKVDAANRRLLPSTAVPSPSLRDSVSRRDVHYRNAKQLKKAVQLQINRAELVFFEPSPDYCEHDHKAGSLGTGGRECNATTHDSADSCRLLCCGRGYDTRRELRREKCNCRFIWCCRVECDECERVVHVHTCKVANGIGRHYNNYDTLERLWSSHRTANDIYRDSPHPSVFERDIWA